MQSPKAVGEVSEGIVLAALLKAGRTVLLPFGNSQPYDMVVDLGGGAFERVQVKTAAYFNGCIIFPTARRNSMTRVRSSYEGQADVFMVYSPLTGAVYRIPVAACGVGNTYLRIEPARGGSKSNVRWAKDYEFG